MTDGSPEKKMPCVEKPEFKAFDTDGDGVLSIGELRSAAANNEQLQSIVEAVEANGIAGLRYTGCGDESESDAGDPSGDAIFDENIARIIARAAVGGSGRG